MANQIQLVMYQGFLANDPELHFTPKGQPVANFRMGSNRTYKNSTTGEKVKETTWLKVTAWGKLGEEVVNKYCAKGSHVIVVGRLRVGENGSPTTYKLDSGDWVASYEIIANEVYIVKGKDNVTPPVETVGEEDLPF